MWMLLTDNELKNEGLIRFERSLEKADGYRIFGVDSLGEKIDKEYSNIIDAKNEYYRLINIHS
jgi:hypothetical protein